MSLAISIPSEEKEESSAAGVKWEMKELKPWHRQLCSLLAQGIDRGTISQILDCTPEYVSMLTRQPKIIEYVNEMAGFASLQLEAQFTKAVTAIGDTLENGNAKEKMMAARLQMEATRRIGSRALEETVLIDTNSRLAKLAERLLYLQSSQHNTQQIIEGEVIHEKEIGEEGTKSIRGAGESAQEDGNGGENFRNREE